MRDVLILGTKTTVRMKPVRLSIAQLRRTRAENENRGDAMWPAPGSKDTELGVLMEPEVGDGETQIYAGVQA